MERYDLLIVGAGAAGMAAALGAAEAGARRVLLADRNDRPGGILPQCIHNGFGLSYYHEDLTGPEYAARFYETLRATNAELRLETTVLELREDRTALLASRAGLERVGFGRCILCCGARERPIGALSVAGTRPAGVFTAGQAQKLVNLGGWDVGRRIVILGSGDIGMIMARRFTLLGREVVLMVEQNGALGGLARNRKQCIEAFHIPLRLRATVTRVHGWPRITGVTVRDLETGAETLVPCDTLVTAVGLIPERELAAPLLREGEAPDWLSFAGNCDRIHEIVDSVSTEAWALGARITGKLSRAKRTT